MDRTDTCWSEADRARVLSEVEDGLWRYVARHARDVAATSQAVADLTGLTPSALDALRRLHALLSDDVVVFVDEALPALLKGLTPVAPPRLGVGRGPVRGPIAWGATTAARARTGGDGTVYASQSAYKHFATPEALLLRRLLTSLVASCDRLNDTVGWGDADGWGTTVARIDGAARAALADRRLARVEEAPPLAPLAVSLAACRRSPRGATRALARAYERYRDLVERPTLEALWAALRERVLLPMQDDALYELWALLGVAAVLDEAGWRLEAAALVGQRPAPFAYRAPNGATARLVFQHAPVPWRESSRYRALFERYGVAGATRRPDLIVELEDGHGRRYLLVEVKRTRDPGYTADSVYKVLGYLADFADVFAGQEGARAILLVWDGVADTLASSAPDALVLATHRDYRARLREILSERRP